jgi:hypothetical protein
VARDAQEHGFPGLYWNTLEDASARALYGKVGKCHEGLVHYAYQRDTSQRHRIAPGAGTHAGE